VGANLLRARLVGALPPTWWVVPWA